MYAYLTNSYQRSGLLRQVGTENAVRREYRRDDSSRHQYSPEYSVPLRLCLNSMCVS